MMKKLKNGQTAKRIKKNNFIWTKKIHKVNNKDHKCSNNRMSTAIQSNWVKKRANSKTMKIMINKATRIINLITKILKPKSIQNKLKELNKMSMKKNVTQTEGKLKSHHQIQVRKKWQSRLTSQTNKLSKRVTKSKISTKRKYKMLIKRVYACK